MIRITPAVKHLLILNVIIFVGTTFLGNKYFFDGILALYYPMSGAFEFWQIGTHMFMHGNLTHLLFNMFGNQPPLSCVYRDRPVQICVKQAYHADYVASVKKNL